MNYGAMNLAKSMTQTSNFTCSLQTKEEDFITAKLSFHEYITNFGNIIYCYTIKAHNNHDHSLHHLRSVATSMNAT